MLYGARIVVTIYFNLSFKVNIIINRSIPLLGIVEQYSGDGVVGLVQPTNLLEFFWTIFATNA